MSDDWAGKTIRPQVGPEQYELLEHLGTGAEAPVWKARLISPNNGGPEFVAVKVFRPDSGLELAGLHQQNADQGRYQGLPTDAPNLVAYLTYFPGGAPRDPGVGGSVLDGHSETMSWKYLVSRFEDGMSLRQFAKGQRGDLRPIASAAVGLGVLHERKLVHGDVKLANILVRIGGIEPVGVVVDLGTLRRFGSTAHSAIGTMGYTAEAQVGEPADPRFDAYSLAVTALALIDEKAAKEDPFALLAVLDDREVSAETIAALRRSLELQPLDEGIVERFAPLAFEQHATQRSSGNLGPDGSSAGPSGDRKQRGGRRADGDDGGDDGDGEVGGDRGDDGGPAVDEPAGSRRGAGPGGAGPSSTQQPTEEWSGLRADDPTERMEDLEDATTRYDRTQRPTGHRLEGRHLLWYQACLWVLRRRNIPAAVLGAAIVGVFVGLVLASVS